MAHRHRGEVERVVAAVVDGEEVHDALEEDVDHGMVVAGDGPMQRRVAVAALNAGVGTDLEQGVRHRGVVYYGRVDRCPPPHLGRPVPVFAPWFENQGGLAGLEQLQLIM